MKKALFIINPRSGRDRVKALQKVINENLDHKVFSHELVYTEYAKHGTRLAKKGVENGFDLIVAVGGDGSVNDVVHGLYGTAAVLGIIPKGSGNGLARSLRIPLDEKKAVQWLNTSIVREIDVGSADNHLFVSNAGVGFDTVVTEKFCKSVRRGFLMYILIIIKSLWSYSPRKWKLKVDGKPCTRHSFMLTAANGAQLGYNFQIAPQAKLDSGYFLLVSIQKFPVLLAATIACRAFIGKIHKSRYVEIRRAKKIELYHPKLTLLQFDGEAVHCSKNIAIKMMPKKLKVLGKG